MIDCRYHLRIRMNRVFTFALLLSVAFGLTGCVSRRSDQPAETSHEPVQTSFKMAEDPDGHFRIRIPSNGLLNKDLEEDGARLLHVEDGKGGAAAIRFYIEETPNSVAVSVGLLSKLEGIKEVKREPVTVAGLEGMKLTVDVTEGNYKNVPYFFLRGPNEKTYIFSLSAGKPWPPFEETVASFEIIK